MKNKEDIIREQRTIEAMKKGYMGTEGKFATIVRFMGESIIRQGSDLGSDFSYLEGDPFWETEEDLPTLDEDTISYPIGYIFNGLSSGINLVISFMEEFREISVRFNDKIVYREVSGDLERFVPSPEWEDKIGNLFLMATKRERQIRVNERKLLTEEATKKSQEFLQKMKEKWGL